MNTKNGFDKREVYGELAKCIQDRNYELACGFTAELAQTPGELPALCAWLHDTYVARYIDNNVRVTGRLTDLFKSMHDIVKGARHPGVDEQRLFCETVLRIMHQKPTDLTEQIRCNNVMITAIASITFANSLSSTSSIAACLQTLCANEQSPCYGTLMAIAKLLHHRHARHCLTVISFALTQFKNGAPAGMYEAPLTSEYPVNVYVTKRNRGDMVWAVWHVLFKSEHVSGVPVCQRYMENLLLLFCVGFSKSAARAKRLNVLLYAFFAAVRGKFKDSTNDLAEAMVQQALSMVHLLYDASVREDAPPAAAAPAATGAVAVSAMDRKLQYLQCYTTSTSKQSLSLLPPNNSGNFGKKQIRLLTDRG